MPINNDTFYLQKNSQDNHDQTQNLSIQSNLSVTQTLEITENGMNYLIIRMDLDKKFSDPN